MEDYLFKIHRAAKHVTELSEMFRKKRPFTYVLETNTKTGQRSTFAKRNETIVREAAVICGDVLHNLRSTIDHIYWDIVSPFAKTDRERKNIQFPFNKTKTGLDESVKNGLPNRVSEAFIQTLVDLKPYGEKGGNELLYAIHQLNITDKHRLLIPTGNYTRLSSDMVRKQVPDFPIGLVDCTFGNTNRDVAWPIPKMNRSNRRAMKIPKSGILEQKLDVPVEIVFSVTGPIDSCPVIPTLHQFIDVTQRTIEILANHKIT